MLQIQVPGVDMIRHSQMIEMENIESKNKAFVRTACKDQALKYPVRNYRAGKDSLKS